MANPDSGKDVTPPQRFAFYKMRLTEVLTQHNPAGLNTIGALLKQFPGKEHQVYIQICKKCGVTPVDPPSPDDFDAEGNPKAQVREQSDEVAKWLEAKGFGEWAKKHQFKSMAWEDFKKIKSKGMLIELGVWPRLAGDMLKLIEAEFVDGPGPDQALPDDEPAPRPALPEQTPDFEVGENCYTKVVSTMKSGGEKWLNARITRVNTGGSEVTYDIFVYNSKAHGVPPEAVNVPRAMLKKGTEKVQVAVPDNKRAAKRPQFQQGDRVRVFGLRSHTSYNGLCGTVLLYVPSERRYQVRLDTNDVIAIKQRNVAPEHGETPSKDADESSKKKKNKAPKGAEAASDTRNLQNLMQKLMADNPNADPGKLGEFAAGYLLAKQKLND